MEIFIGQVCDINDFSTNTMLKLKNIKIIVGTINVRNTVYGNFKGG